jgi:hypothetical protein
MLFRMKTVIALALGAGLLCAPRTVTAENPKKGTIAGTIVLEDGSPAPVKGEMNYHLQTKNGSVHGSAGRFSHEFQLKLAPGTLWLTHYAEGYAPAWAGPIQVEAGKEIKDVKIVLKQGFTQRLKITDVDGQPIPGVKIVAHPEINGNAGGPVVEKTADENGEYLYEHLADTKYVFQLKAPGFQPLTSDPIELEPDADLPVNMRRAHPCTGVILNADGTPAANAKLRLRYELRPEGRGAGYSGRGKGFWGKTMSVTDEAGRFVLDQMRDGSHYLFVVETADKARAVVHHLRAGEEDVRITVPKRRDVVVTVTGDLSEIPRRRGKPFVAVRQRVPFQSTPGQRYRDLIGEDALLEQAEGRHTATIRGLAVDLSPDAEEQEVEVSLGYGSKHKKTVKLNLDGVTRVEFDLAKD